MTTSANIVYTRDPMNSQDRLAWLDRHTNQIPSKFRSTFIAGANEHKSDIGEQTMEVLLNQMEKEAIDQYWYVQELRRRLNHATVQTNVQLDQANHS